MPKELHAHISDSLTDSEWKALRLFCEKSEVLRRTKLLSEKGSRGKATISFRDGQMIPEASLPPEERIVEFLAAFRFFYLQKEPTHFPSILGILGKHSPDPDFRQALKVIRDRWDNSLLHDAVRITSNGQRITTSLILDLWFNSHYFHSDEDKRKSLDDLRASFGEGFSKFMLVDSTVGSSEAILFIHQAIRDMVAKQASA